LELFPYRLCGWWASIARKCGQAEPTNTISLRIVTEVRILPIGMENASAGSDLIREGIG